MIKAVVSKALCLLRMLPVHAFMSSVSSRGHRGRQAQHAGATAALLPYPGREIHASLVSCMQPCGAAALQP